MFIIKIFNLFLLGTTFLFADSYNMELLSNLSYEQNTSDITAFYQDSREFAVIGLQNAASFVDVTDPYNPFEISRIGGGTSLWRDLKYWNRHVYIGTEAEDGVKVVSVDDPDNPVLVNTILDFDNNHNIHVADGYLYVVGADIHDIWIYDLTDPANPELAGFWDTEYIHDLHVYNDIAYAMGIYTSTAYIIDVSDKANPQTLASWNYPGMAHDCAVSEDENYLITADEMAGGHIKIWDISNYSNINLLDEYMTDPQHSVHNVYIIGDIVYMSYYADGTRILSMEDPNNLVEIGYYDTSDIEGLYVGNWGVDPFLPSGNIVSSDIETGLYITRFGGVTISHDPIADMPADSDYIYFSADATSYSGAVTSVTLNYSINFSDWNSVNMNEVGEGMYSAGISSPPNGSIVEYYIQASNNEGSISFFPSEGADSPVMFVYGELQNILYDDIESNNLWQVGVESDNATAGSWEWGVPFGTAYGDIPVQTDEDHSINGQNCFVTGNANVNGTPSADDVDGGKTTLLSPAYDVSGHEEVLLTYWRWYTNNLGDNPSTDLWKVSVSGDQGDSWVELESTNISDNSWKKMTFFVGDYIDIESTIQLRFVAEDVGYPGDSGSGGSIVEAAVDDISLDRIGVNIILGDANLDGNVDVLDIVLSVSFALGNSVPGTDQFFATDINSDGEIDILDIVSIVNLILE